jgi:hypothetical protein
LGQTGRVIEQAIETVTQQAINLGLYNGLETLDDVNKKNLPTSSARNASVPTLPVAL